MTKNQDNSGRGFAGMDQDKQREIASKGGKASHESGNAHEFDSQEAREAGAQSRKNSGQGNSGGNQSGSGNSSSGMRGGSSEQHAEAGRQSHKND